RAPRTRASRRFRIVSKWRTCAGLLWPEGVTDVVEATHSEGSVRIRPRCGFLLREDCACGEASRSRTACATDLVGAVAEPGPEPIRVDAHRVGMVDCDF